LKDIRAMGRRFSFVMVVAAAFAIPALTVPALAEETAGPAARAPQASARASVPEVKPVPAKRAKRTLKRGPQSYGFLPGYEAPPDNNRPDYRRNARSPYADGRYWSWGQWYYGYGQPGYMRGRWNGGSIGPCWKSTPIGYSWICG
jgi:hypothetical protein